MGTGLTGEITEKLIPFEGSESVTGIIAAGCIKFT